MHRGYKVRILVISREIGFRCSWLYVLPCCCILKCFSNIALSGVCFPRYRNERVVFLNPFMVSVVDGVPCIEKRFYFLLRIRVDDPIVMVLVENATGSAEGRVHQCYSVFEWILSRMLYADKQSNNIHIHPTPVPSANESGY